jgi:guanylate kinase
MEVAPSGRVVVVSGPSGVGKTTLVDRLFQDCPLPLVRIVTVTTRPPRAGETDGVDYHFVSPARFAALRDDGRFLECFELFGRGYWYGSLASEVLTGIRAGKWVVLNIDVQGAASVMVKFPSAVTIFVRPGSIDELRSRLKLRGTDGPDDIEKRLQRAEYELSQAHHYRYQVVNDDLHRAVTELCNILTEEREKD